MQLSPDQQYALDVLSDWFSSESKKPYITLGGYAGTGKTTLISVFRARLHKINPKLKVAFVSYTGKASRVLQTKIEQAKTKFPKDFIGTIHSLIYSPLVDTHSQEIIGWEQKEKIGVDLIIIDEASMVDQKIWQDLLSYAKPIIAIGDHGQLPPINGNFNLMQKPEIKLEQIHRQAQGNPIIALSQIARETGEIEVGNYGVNIKKLSRSDADTQSEIFELLENYNSNTLILCGYNNTRVRINQQIRQNLGFENPAPQASDRVICLRNNHKKQIFNGMIGTIHSISQEGDYYMAKIEMDEGINFQGMISSEQFNLNTPLNFTQKRKQTTKIDLFDFGYAMTVHKAQGSEAEKVVLFEERFKQMDDEMWRRWLYTAITRAQKELIIVG